MTYASSPADESTAAAAPQAPPRPGPRPVLAAAVAGAALVAAGSFAGWWWLPFALGLVLGVASRLLRVPRSVALPVPVAAAVAGWAFPLAWRAASGAPIAATSRTVAALAALPDSAALPIALTLLLAAIQALTATWLAAALTPPRGGR
jgi:hypothetical protein